MVQSAAFFHGVASEEILINTLLEEGKNCINQGKYDDAIYLYGEASLMEKWKDTYGRVITANLAYA